MQALLLKIKEASLSVFPVALIVLITMLLPITAFTADEIITFAVSSVLLVIGIGLFNLGADSAMTPMGDMIGTELTKSRKVSLLLIIVFVMGVLITIAEPDLSVLASQLSDAINPTVLIIVIGLGVGLFLLIGVIKIIFRQDLSHLLFFFYMAAFALTTLIVVNGRYSFIPLSFDSGGVTTGPITVPFIMALGVGIAGIIGGKGSNENSFGLVALCSIGPIIALMILVLCGSGSVSYEPDLSSYALNTDANYIFVTAADTALEIIKALGLLLIFFFILQFTVLKLPKRKIRSILKGICFTFAGLLIFLSSVKIGYLPIGYKLGTELAENKLLVIIFGFILGGVVVLAEPAIHVLNGQVEEITDGLIKKKSMLIALSAGVGISIGLSIIRIIFNFSVLYYLIPGYLLSLGLSFFVPKIYTSIAFDSGGVASGPLTSSFILPFAIGLCAELNGASEILSLAFGIVAMVAMTPLITIQLLGFKGITTKKVKKTLELRKISRENDEQIIRFM